MVQAHHIMNEANIKPDESQRGEVRSVKRTSLRPQGKAKRPLTMVLIGKFFEVNGALHQRLEHPFLITVASCIEPESPERVGLRCKRVNEEVGIEIPFPKNPGVE